MRRKRDGLKILYIVSLSILLGVVGIRPSQAEDSWTSKTPMPTERLDSVSGVIDGKIYVIGGWIPPKGAKTKKVEVYDPVTDTWDETKADLLDSVVHTAAGVVDGKIYVIGGQWSNNPMTAGFKYDPVSDTWTSIASMPTARYGHSIGVWDGKIYVIGGAGGAGGYKNEMYDPNTDTWTSKAPLPTTYRDHLGVATVNNKLYVIGGRHGYSSNPYDLNEEYDPVTDTWTTKAPMLTARAAFYELAVVDNKIYVMGGENGITDSVYSENEMYNPATDNWTAMAPLPTPRHGISIQAVNNKIYTIGGGLTAYYAWSDVNEEYTPPSNQSPVADAGPDQTVTDEDNDGKEQVTLDGSASQDPDGTIVSYVWSEDGLQIATGVNPTVVLSIGTHSITLTVTDDEGLTDTDTVTITVSPPNQHPIADAGPDQTVIDEDSDGSEQVTLDGSASRDPDGTIVSFIWSEGGLQIATGINPTVILSTGTHLITLTVTDNGGLTDTDTVTIKVLEKEKEFGKLPTGCYNNVFNPTKGEKALIVVELSKQARVKVDLYNTRGNKIRELVNEEKEADVYKYYWDGKDDNGNVVGSGLYFVHIQAGDYKKTKKIVVVK